MGQLKYSSLQFSIMLKLYIISALIIALAVVQSYQEEIPYDQYQTAYDTSGYYEQDATATQYDNEALNFLSNFAVAEKQSIDDMTMISMGASVTAAVVAIGALAYALTLEGRILTNDARSLSTCNALNTITTATLTTVPAVAAANCPIATAGSPTQAELLACINALRTSVNTNLVTPINAYGNPTC